MPSTGPTKRAGQGTTRPAQSLLERLRQGSPEFAAWWTAHGIRNVDGGRKQLEHPKKGKLRFEHASFQANDDPASLSSIRRRSPHRNVFSLPGTSTAAPY
jgi:hypothetical protein